jgi:SpoVK/Ycf46/Vps4 family AAA+-type ATPase
MDAPIENQFPVDIYAPLLDRIDMLIEAARGSKLDDNLFAKYRDLILSIAVNLQLSMEQAVLLMPFIANADETVKHRDLRCFFECSPTMIMRYSEDLTQLVHRRYLFHRNQYGTIGLSLTKKAGNALTEGHGLREVSMANLSPNDFMKAVNELYEEFIDKRHLLPEEFNQELQILIDGNRKLPIVKAIETLELDYESIVFLLYFCKRLVYESQPNVSLDTLSELVEDFTTHGWAFAKGKHVLIKKKLVQPSGGEQLMRDMFTLTTYAKKKLLKDYDIVEEQQEEVDCSRFKVVKAKDIKEKHLFYSEQNQKELAVISELLSEAKWHEVRNNLKENGMRQGFNCLFHGAPGTGKTETVLQLARKTGRDIMQVDISTVRDKWFGETEKIVKDIFVQYGKLVKQSKRTPILLFNEADAILSVRSDLSNSHSTDKTENAIQNILLQEMENLDGIMIATTNLVDNFDKAFERRFIYKVRFEQPSVEAKTFIWKSQLNDLEETDAASLARSYDFSGGQIENVARKVFVEKLLFSKEIGITRLVELCEEERLDKECSRRAIGFRA